MINIIIRVDGGNIIGTGHIYRCLNLVNYIENANIEFICKNFNSDIISKISNQYKCHLLQPKKNYKITYNKKTWLGDSQKDDAEKTIEILKTKKYNWIIIDHYSIDLEWEIYIRNYVDKIFVIDDYTNRKHNCDVLLNQLLNNKYIYIKI